MKQVVLADPANLKAPLVEQKERVVCVSVDQGVGEGGACCLQLEKKSRRTLRNLFARFQIRPFGDVCAQILLT